MYDNITIFSEDAEYLINRFNARKVIKLLKKRIEKGAKTAQNYAFLANAYQTIDDNKNALKYAHRAKRLDKNYYYADFLLVLIYADEGKHRRAENALNDLFEKAPDTYFTKYFAAMNCFVIQEPNFEKVKKYADELLSLPVNENAEFYICMCYAYYMKGELAKALKYLMKAIIDRLPNINDSWLILLGTLSFLLISQTLNMDIPWKRVYYYIFKNFLPIAERYYLKSDIEVALSPEEALVSINKAIELNSQSTLYLMRKGSILLYLEEYEKSISCYKKALELDATCVESFFYMATSYLALKDYKNALEFINSAILNNVQPEASYYHKATILRKLGKSDEAIKVLKKIETNFPQSPNLYYVMADLYCDVEDYKKALLSINKQLMKEKDMYNYRRKLYILYFLDNYGEAIKAGCEALKFEEDALVYYWLACAYGRNKEYSKALQSINKSILLDKGDENSFYVKSEILEAMGRNDEASAAYQKAKELGYKD